MSICLPAHSGYFRGFGVSIPGYFVRETPS
jgi:hypothetical protein